MLPLVPVTWPRRSEMAKTQPLKEYDLTDVQAVYQRGVWHSWSSLRRWIENEGLVDDELTHAEVQHIGEDLKNLEAEGVAFTDDPDQAFHLLREYCSH